MTMTQRSPGAARVLAVVAVLGIGAGLVLDLRPARTEIAWLAMSEALRKGKELHKPVFLDVSAGWCRPCTQMDRTVFSVDSIRRLLEDAFVVARLDIDDPSVSTEEKQRLDVEMLPSFVIFTPEGIEWKRSTGYMEPARFGAWIRENSGGYVLSWETLNDAAASAREKGIPLMVVWVATPSLLEPTYRLLGTSSMREFVAANVVPTVVVGADPSNDPLLQRLRASADESRCLMLLSPDGRELRRVGLDGITGLDADRLLDTLRAALPGVK